VIATACNAPWHDSQYTPDSERCHQQNDQDHQCKYTHTIHVALSDFVKLEERVVDASRGYQTGRPVAIDCFDNGKIFLRAGFSEEWRLLCSQSQGNHGTLNYGDSFFKCTS
jgi:hypothetical protein